MLYDNLVNHWLIISFESLIILNNFRNGNVTIKSGRWKPGVAINSRDFFVQVVQLVKENGHHNHSNKLESNIHALPNLTGKLSQKVIAQRKIKNELKKILRQNRNGVGQPSKISTETEL